MIKWESFCLVVTLAASIGLTGCFGGKFKPKTSFLSENQESSFDVAQKAVVKVFGKDGFEEREISYVDSEGLAVFQGDMIIGTSQDVQSGTSILPLPGISNEESILRGLGVAGSAFRWTNSTINYVFDIELPEHYKARFHQAAQMWSSVTNVRFQEFPYDPSLELPKNIAFIVASSNSCRSTVGMRDFYNRMWLSERCNANVIAHEIGHMLGLWHEHNRQDRDQFIRIMWRNIHSSQHHEYEIVQGLLLGAYDIRSIMHYYSSQGSVNSLPIMKTVFGEFIEPQVGLSAGDIAAINNMYPPARDPAENDGDILQFSVNPIMFPGMTPIGETRTQYLDISNNAFIEHPDIAATVTFEWGAMDAAFSTDATTVNMFPGDSNRIAVQFTPTVEKQYSAVLQISAYGEEFLIPVLGIGFANQQEEEVTSPNLVADPADVFRFNGQTNIGDIKRGIIKLTNSGDGDDNIRVQLLNNTDNEFFVETNNLPQVIVPGQIVDIPISFQPRLPGAKQAMLKVNSKNKEVNIYLEGQAVVVDNSAPVLSTYIYDNPNKVMTDTANFDSFFGPSPQYTKIVLYIDVANEGDAPLTLDLQTTGESYHLLEDYSNVAPQGYVRLPIAFIPQSVGLQQGQLIINTNAGNFTYALMGTSMAPPDGRSFGDVYLGSNGDDIFHGLDGEDNIRGGLGNDTLDGNKGNDIIRGELGDDQIIGGQGNDELHGGPGNDNILGGPDSDTIYGGEGRDVLRGETGNDRVIGGPGNDELHGGLGNDVVEGNRGNDTLHGGNDDDVLIGGSDNDILYGNVGNDQLRGDEGNDELHGGGGEDVLHGGPGNDNLYGGSDRDTLIGGRGSDTLDGYFGRDTLDGKEGSDTYIFKAGYGYDIITDISGANDRVECDIRGTLRAGRQDPENAIINFPGGEELKIMGYFDGGDTIEDISSCINN